MAPEICARAAASASTAPLSSISFSADCLKYPIAVTGTESRNLDTRKRVSHDNHIYSESGLTCGHIRAVKVNANLF